MLHPVTPPKLTPDAIAALRRSGFVIEFPRKEQPSRVQSLKRSYMECRKRGLCVRCGCPAKLVNGRPGVLCDMHAEMNRVASMERRRKNK